MSDGGAALWDCVQDQFPVMTGIGYFQYLQAIHFTSSSSQRQNKPEAFCVLFCCETMDAEQEGVW